MKITVLGSLESDDPKSYDVVVDQVASALRKHKHRVSIFGIHDDLRKFVSGFSRRQPDLVFNLAETFGESLNGDSGVAAVLDLLGFHYTGGGPGELYLRQDKGLAKKVLAFEGVQYPHFAIFGKDADLESAGKLRMPLFVKPLTAHASIGLDGDSPVRDAISLMKRVVAIHEKVGDSALVEEYIEGREFYVGVLGNREPVAFPPIEMDFSGLPPGAPRVLDYKAKWEKGTKEFKGTWAVLPDLPDELKARLQQVA